MTHGSESEFEAHVRRLVDLHVTSHDPSVYALKNKKAVDILICKDRPRAELFFLEVKFHKHKHGRLGFGSGKGGGFQPEILGRRPAYFESNLRWVLADETHHKDTIVFVTSEVLRQYLSGGAVGEKHNNIQLKILLEQRGLNEGEFAEELRSWLGVTTVGHGIDERSGRTPTLEGL